MELSHQQRDMLAAAGDPGCRVSISSGHGTGKSKVFGAYIWWHTIVHPCSQLMVTANNLDQIKNVLWKYVAETWIDLQKRVPWVGEYFEMSPTRVFARHYKQLWFAFGKTCRPGREESLAGQHNDWYTIICDEASGISTRAFRVMTGALTDSRNRMIMMSQPTRPVGYFYDSHHKYSVHDVDASYKGRAWTTFTLSSEESRWVDDSFLHEKAMEYGGRDSAEYMIKVRGLFPPHLDGYLLSKADMDKATRIELEHDENIGFIATVDVGMGVFRDSSVMSVWSVSGYGHTKKAEQLECKIYPGDMDPDTLGRHVNDHLLAKEDLYPEITIGVDYHGCGYQTIKVLEDLGNFAVEKLRWGGGCWSKSDKGRFANRRAMATIFTRDAIQQGRMKLLPEKRMLEEGARIPCDLNDRCQWRIMPKPQMAAKGIKSPDIFDTVCFVFLFEHVSALPSVRQDDHDDEALRSLLLELE